jgi:hypothetical protein
MQWKYDSERNTTTHRALLEFVTSHRELVEFNSVRNHWEEFTMAQWENLGDVNPIQHGGFWITQDKDRENCFYVLSNQPSEEIEDQHTFYDLYFDLTDSWIEWDQVESSCDKTDDPLRKCQNLFWYYGGQNFGDAGRTIDTNELKEILDRHSIF